MEKKAICSLAVFGAFLWLLPSAGMGVGVTNVAGQAREQGLRRGDLVVEVNGRPIREPMDFFLAVRPTPLGDPVGDRVRAARRGVPVRTTDRPRTKATPGPGGS